MVRNRWKSSTIFSESSNESARIYSVVARKAENCQTVMNKQDLINQYPSCACKIPFDHKRANQKLSITDFIHDLFWRFSGDQTVLAIIMRSNLTSSDCSYSTTRKVLKSNTQLNQIHLKLYKSKIRRTSFQRRNSARYWHQKKIVVLTSKQSISAW